MGKNLWCTFSQILNEKYKVFDKSLNSWVTSKFTIKLKWPRREILLKKKHYKPYTIIDSGTQGRKNKVLKRPIV